MNRCYKIFALGAHIWNSQVKLILKTNNRKVTIVELKEKYRVDKTVLKFLEEMQKCDEEEVKEKWKIRN